MNTISDANLAAIRERDGCWTNNGHRNECEVARADRRELLRYIDALEADVLAMLGEIGTDLMLIKKAHREYYRAKPAPDAATLFEEQAAERRREYDQDRKR